MKICGIDEAGRGPLAGPLLVAGVILNNKHKIKGLNDSKVLSAKKRESLFEEIKNNSKYHIVSTSANEIDKKGLSKALRDSILEIMENLKDENISFLMDGNTSFGINNLDHKIKADATVPEVSAASILAKVTRDRYMCEIASSFEQYDFDKHKGYGTKAHVQKIKEFGRCEQHRYTFKLKALGEDKVDSKQASLF